MLNAKARALLIEAADQPNLKPLEAMSPAQARRQMQATTDLLPEGPQLAQVRDVEANGRHGTIPIRIYHPTDDQVGVVVFFHGGGWVIGSVNTHEAYCRHLAATSGMAVASVEYRLAPEFRFPAAIDDSVDATCWLSENGSPLNLDTGCISVAGDSAGGNLAAAVCLACRDQDGPMIQRQALIYPITDFAIDTPSYQKFADGYHLTRAAMAWFWNHYLSHPSDAENHLAAPMKASDLSRLPPALVLTAEYDPLRDEGEAYARRLVEDGVIVTTHRALGMVHGFIRRFDAHPEAATALDLVAGFLANV